jgi:hypothetical protein
MEGTVKKLLLFIGLLTMGQALFAARGSVYNHMKESIFVILESRYNISQKKEIPANHRYTFNNGLPLAFSGILVARGTDKPALWYSIPSSATMLKGRIDVGPQLLQCVINFDKDGADETTKVKIIKSSDAMNGKDFNKIWESTKEGSGDTEEM